MEIFFYRNFRKILLLLIFLLSTRISAQTNDEKQKAADLLKEGMSLQEAGLHKEAIEIFNQALRIVDHPKIKYRKAMSFEATGKFKDAYEIYDRIKDAEEVKEKKKEIYEKLQKLKTEITGYGGIYVKSFPEEAIVYLDGKKQSGVTPLTIHNIMAGRHILKIEKGNYKGASTVTVEKDAYVTVELKLETLPGKINCYTEPPEADVFLDGKLSGKTPVILRDIPPGSHSILFSKEGFSDEKFSVTLYPGQASEITVRLKSYGKFSLKTPGVKAEIFIDGKSQGYAPVNIEKLTSGSHKIELRAEGYKTLKKEIFIKSSQTNNFTEKMEQFKGKLKLLNIPEKAEIYVDGNKIDVGLNMIIEVGTGSHFLEIKTDIFKPVKEMISIKEGETLKYSPSLKREKCSLSVTSEPSSAEIAIDGKIKKFTPLQNHELDCGDYNIKISKKGYETITKKITIDSSKTFVMHEELRQFSVSIMIGNLPPDSEVIIDGNYAGTGKEVTAAVSPGDHEIIIRASDYEIFTQKIEVKASVKISPKLTLLKAGITIESTPVSADVFIDQKPSGKTPLTISNLSPGEHAVTITAYGYKEITGKISVSPGKIQKLNYDLIPVFSKIRITGLPEDAKVFINETEVGTGSDIETRLPLGNYTVVVISPAYEKFVKEINILSDQAFLLKPELKPVIGTLIIKNILPDAAVYIDGKLAGKGPMLTKTLGYGAHKLKILHPDSMPYEETIQISSKIPVVISPELSALKGSLKIISVPMDAEVFIDGENKGNTPLAIYELTTGFHDLVVNKKGYETYKEKIKIKAEETEERIITLDLSKGIVKLADMPENAEVYVDGQKAGTGKEVTLDLVFGTHDIVVKVQSFELFSRKIEITSNDTIKITPALHAIKTGISIHTTPQDADVYLNGKSSGKTPLNLLNLNAGEYSVKITKDGFREINQKIILLPKKPQKLSYHLEPLTSKLSIHGLPQNAKVILNGMEIGRGPKVETELPFGKYSMEIVCDGYEKFEKEIKITSNLALSIRPDLASLEGTIIIKNIPAKASVLIDGKYAGKGPLIKKSLGYGEHYIEIKHPDYQTYREKINIDSKTPVILSPELLPLSGNITIASNPSDALVIIDGKKKGKTPLTVDAIRTGTHKLVIIKEGFYQTEKEIIINLSKNEGIFESLNPIKANLIIADLPLNAEVSIDGKPAGTGKEVNNTVSYGKHEIIINVPAHELFTKIIEVKTGDTIKITPELRLLSGGISIETNPSQAEVFINGKSSGKTPLIIDKISSGEYKIKVSKKGFYQIEDMIKVTPGKPQKFDYKLQPVLVKLSISELPEDSRVVINGSEIGKGHQIETVLPFGTYVVEIFSSEYEKFTKEIVVSNDPPLSIKPELKPLKGLLRLKNMPVKAKVFIDGKPAGTGIEIEKEIALGKHNIEIKHPDYKRFEEEVTIRLKDPVEISPKLIPLRGNLAVISDPAGADVFIDGKKKGSTPLKISFIKSGFFYILFDKNGYKQYRKKIEISAGEEQKIDVELEPLKGLIDVKTNPDGAEISMDDGWASGKSPFEFKDISHGSHEIVISKEGYEKKIEKFEIGPGEKKKISVKLKEIPKQEEPVIVEKKGALKEVETPSALIKPEEPVSQIKEPESEEKKKTEKPLIHMRSPAGFQIIPRKPENTEIQLKKPEQKTEEIKKAEDKASEEKKSSPKEGEKPPVVAKPLKEKTYLWTYAKWISAGLSAASLTAGLICMFDANTKIDQLNNPEDLSQKEAYSLRQDASALKTATYSLYGISGALLSGFFLFDFLEEIESEKEEKYKTTAVIRPLILNDKVYIEFKW